MLRSLCVPLLALTLLLLPAFAQGESSPAAEAMNNLGLRLLTVTDTASDQNLILSPLSIQSALAMTSTGAAGATLTEMHTVLGIGSGEAAFAGALNAIISELNQAARSSHAESGEPLEWSLANRLFVEETFSLQASFQRNLESLYGAGLRTDSFRTAPEAARLRINAWVAETTQARLRNLIPAGGVDRQTTIVLVNGLFLKAPWADPFQEHRTTEAPFRLEQGGTTPTRLMRRVGTLRFVQSPRYTAVALPYRHGGLQAIFLLPAEGTRVSALLKEISAADLTSLAEAPLRPVDLALPRFTEAGETIDLASPLEQLGMRQAFDIPPGSADFSRMSAGTDRTHISAVFHQTFLAVDERGTEAAAATAVTLLRGAPPGPGLPPVPFTADRPFLFGIQHQPSGACLFLGVVRRPRT